MSFELIHSRTTPKFRIVRPPIDAEILPRSPLTLSYVFKTMCESYTFTGIDERGVTHKTEGGHILQYQPKYRLRFDLNWDYIRVGKVVGGVIDTLTSDSGEYEFLTYLLRNKDKFSYTGFAELYLTLNHIIGSSDPMSRVVDDKEYRVVLLSGGHKTSNPAEVHGFSLVLETIDFVDLPFTLNSNRSASV